MSDNYQGPGRYRHYKGGEYEVLGLALSEETVDKPSDPKNGPGREWEETRVIYRPLTPGSMLEHRDEDFWSRELSVFNEQAGMPGQPRFEKIG